VVSELFAFGAHAGATFVAMVVARAVMGIQVSQLVAEEVAPVVGVIERINIGAFLLCVAVLAAALWPRRLTHRSQPRPSGPLGPDGSRPLEGRHDNSSQPAMCESANRRQVAADRVPVAHCHHRLAGVHVPEHKTPGTATVVAGRQRRHQPTSSAVGRLS
jgi:hypothetical protein